MALNPIARIKELISILNAADREYYGEDDPSLSDHEYDALMDELRKLESETGIVFAGSPTQKVSGANRAELPKVHHTKPMLSAQKTKSADEAAAFSEGRDVMLS